MDIIYSRTTKFQTTIIFWKSCKLSASTFDSLLSTTNLLYVLDNCSSTYDRPNPPPSSSHVPGPRNTTLAALFQHPSSPLLRLHPLWMITAAVGGY